MNELVFKPAYELARMIKQRQVSSVEVLEAHLNQISQHNSKLNAICTLNDKRPLAKIFCGMMIRPLAKIFCGMMMGYSDFNFWLLK